MERKTNKCESLQSFWKQMLHQKRRWKNEKVWLSCGKKNTCWLLKYKEEYKCYNLILNKVVESINVTIDETGRPESEEEENKSMEQLFEEEDEKEVEEEDEENLIEA